MPAEAPAIIFRAMHDGALPLPATLLAATLDWDRLDDLKYMSEGEACEALLARNPLSPADRAAVVAEAAGWCAPPAPAPAARAWWRASCRSSRLGTREGLALMCLAEALLRTPDDATRDALIAEKIGSADWASAPRPVGQPVRQRLHLGADAHRQADRRRTRRPSATCRASSRGWPAGWASR